MLVPPDNPAEGMIHHVGVRMSFCRGWPGMQMVGLLRSWFQVLAVYGWSQVYIVQASNPNKVMVAPTTSQSKPRNETKTWEKYSRLVDTLPESTGPAKPFDMDAVHGPFQLRSVIKN